MRYVIFGESHGPAIGVVLEGVPAGLELDLERVSDEMASRAVCPGRRAARTARAGARSGHWAMSSSTRPGPASCWK